jgi:3',5'-cyclic-AMP phosphodiesterase
MDAQDGVTVMQVLSIDTAAICEIPYSSAASGGGVSCHRLSLLKGTVDWLPDDLSALLVTSDLQGVAPSADSGGALALLGVVLAETLRELELAEMIPTRAQIGVLLGGDLFATPAGDKRGATGDVRPVWTAFAREARWVAGVAGNHDLFGSNQSSGHPGVRRGAHLLDGAVVEIDGLRIAGVGGIIGNSAKPNRRDAESFLALLARVLEQHPHVLVLHEGPDDPTTGSKGNTDIRALLNNVASETLVVCGHSIWQHPLARISGTAQVLNVAERAVLLTRI